MPRIYISHRPEDSSRNDVRIIRERLIEVFGVDNVIDTASDHMDTTQERQAVIKSCDILLVVIGQYWHNMVDEQDNKLLEDPIDPVHVELSQARESGLDIRLLLVDEVEQPKAVDLPEVLWWMITLKALSTSNEQGIMVFIDSFIDEIQTQETLYASVVSREIKAIKKDPSSLQLYVSYRPAPQNEEKIYLILSTLQAKFGSHNVFSTTDVFEEDKFSRDYIIQSCDILVIVMSENWFCANDNLIDKPDDPIYKELLAGIEANLSTRVLMIDDIPLPARDTLPPELQPILQRSSYTGRTQTELKSTLNYLIPILSRSKTQIKNKKALTKRQRPSQTTAQEVKSNFWREQRIRHQSYYEGDWNSIGCLVLIFLIGVGLVTGVIGFDDLIIVGFRLLLEGIFS
jgi:hypothetical protein